MADVSLVGKHAAGGTILGPGAVTWTWDGLPISLVGDAVRPHGEPPHHAPKIATGSSWMTIDGIPVTMSMSRATCGHTATGDPTFTIPE
jgi:uncharacterized Zn-binding protein involved in type VI secretion